MSHPCGTAVGKRSIFQDVPSFASAFTLHPEKAAVLKGIVEGGNWSPPSQPLVTNSDRLSLAGLSVHSHLWRGRPMALTVLTVTPEEKKQPSLPVKHFHLCLRASVTQHRNRRGSLGDTESSLYSVYSAFQNALS
ncbi:hypothetical protein JZ751_010261 [Albula glossodonta]|uniref:Uncharacterized protein n=1 Tax=Albula glossodonta TaxID=121402 RepID=A0A8T2N2U5_9TELE|nr:hypothetical protein JZ751_010261 [Albula glossodonta]